MSHRRVNFQPAENLNTQDEDMYYKLGQDWQRKAQALQVRRWRALKREMKGRF